MEGGRNRGGGAGVPEHCQQDQADGGGCEEAPGNVRGARRERQDEDRSTGGQVDGGKEVDPCQQLLCEGYQGIREEGERAAKN